MIRRCLPAVLALALVAAISPPRAAAEPAQRIVSLNLCTDQILVDLVPAERIAALSHVAADAATSSIADRAARFTRIRGDAEEVLALDPDLIVTTEYSTPTTVSLLERLGRRVVKIPFARDIAGVRDAVQRLAEAVGAAETGKAVIANLDRRLAALSPPSRDTAAPTAVIYQVNGLASGPGTLEDEALRLAGFRNLAPALNLDPGGRVALEAIVASPPDLLVLSGPSGEYRTVVADNLSHPALAAAMRNRATLVVPWRHWLCGTPYIADAIEALADARRRLAPKRASSIQARAASKTAFVPPPLWGRLGGGDSRTLAIKAPTTNVVIPPTPNPSPRRAGRRASGAGGGGFHISPWVSPLLRSPA